MNSIEKQIQVPAPLTRVWRALTDPAEFEAWFGMRLSGPLVPGARVPCAIVGTTVDPEVAKAQQQHSGVPYEITVDSVVPRQLFSFRWHPAAVDHDVDYSAEPVTLVSFALQENATGVLVSLTESGFDQIPEPRRNVAYSANNQGWTIMLSLLERYLR